MRNKILVLLLTLFYYDLRILLNIICTIAY